MANLKVYNTDGKEIKNIEVSDAVFGRDYNEALIHQVIVAQLANKRQGTKSTLTRTEVRGGGIKPWRQKGTGRARQGSIRAPQWIKGGVVFAPKPRDFSKHINKKMKTGALLSALSEKVRADELIVVDKIELKEAKTKLMAKVLDNLSCDKKTLIVYANENENLRRASGNIERLTTENVTLLNVYDLVRSSKCVMTEEAVNMLLEVYA